jgi:SAM-dependent methyltransferase
MAHLPAEFPTESVDSCPLCGAAERTLWNRDADDISAVECADCGLVYLDRRLTDAALTSLLAKRRRMYAADRHFVRLFLPAGKLLDVGCGRGDFLAEFGEEFRKIGHDIDRGALAEGRNHYPRIAFLDDRSRIAEQAPFDAVVFRGTLQYQRDLRETSQLMLRIVRPGGWLFLLQTPNAESPAAMLQREHWALHNKWEHLYTFSLKTLARLFSDFETVRYEFPYVGTPYENLPEDLARFVRVCRGEQIDARFPFWGSMMNVAMRRQPG